MGILLEFEKINDLSNFNDSSIFLVLNLFVLEQEERLVNEGTCH